MKKFNFRKISAIAGSLLLTGMTLGMAAAANYPAPFVSGGTANVAIVYGTGAGVSSLDIIQAGNLQTDLQAYMGTVSTGSGSSVEGGDSVLLERTSDKLNLGDNAATVFVTSVTGDDMTNLLADGTYIDDDNTDYAYTQKITLGSNLGIEHFQDSDYNNDEPTIGIYMSGSEHVLNYTLDFTTNPAYNASTMETTTLRLMGKDYYVLDVKGLGDTGADNKTTLLDTASSAIITEGETTTVSGKDVSIAYISTSAVKLTVDGQTTNSLANGATYKLSDGTYVGIKDILYDAKDSGISKVEVSIGNGKLELIDGTGQGANIELNDVTVEEIKSFMQLDSTTTKLNKIVLQWTTDDESFIAGGSDLVMPGFGAVKISMGDFVQPKQELTTVENSGSDVIQLKTTLKSGAVTIPLLKADSAGDIASIGKDTSNRLVTTTDTFLFLNETAGDKYFVASWNSSTEAESYYLQFDVTTEDNVLKLKVKDIASGADWKKVTNVSTISFGSVVLTVNELTDSGTNEWANISINSGGSFHELYTKEGLKVYLPYYAVDLDDGASYGALNNTVNSTGVELAGYWVRQGIYNVTLATTTGHGSGSYYSFFGEEDKDANLGKRNFNVTIDESGTSNKVHVSDMATGSNEYEIGDTDNFESYVVSDLATKLVYKTGGDQDTVDITYAGTQSYAELYLTSPDATVTGGTTGGASQLGDVLVKDSEVSSVATKNLIVVGGSCINTAAASLVGGTYCGAMFTENTGVGTGQFLIKGYADSTITSKVALLVAGYEAADTVNAATYLRTKPVDTSKEYLGTSSTATAKLVTETA